MISALNDEKRQEAPPFAIDALNRYRPFPIARLDSLTSSMSIGACHYHRYTDNAHHKPSLIEVVEVAVVDAVLGLHVVHKLKPCANKLWIFVEGSLKVICAIETHLELWLSLNKLLSLMLANASAVASRKKQIGYIFNTS
jgi:hypothetical protein